MRRRQTLLIVACLLGALLSTGASCSPLQGKSSKSGQSQSSSLVNDRAGVALAAARAQMESVAPDAVPIMVGSAGVALNPPPEQWQILFASRATGRTYSVSVSHDKAEKPRDMGGMKLTSDALVNAIPYDELKLGSDAAYAKAKAELAKKGAVPSHAMESVTLVEIPSLPGSKPAMWQVSFLNGTSTTGMRQANVDAMTGAVTVTK